MSESSASTQPYSVEAMKAATGSNVRPCYPTPGLERVFMALDAAHDRQALGLDASVCARTFLDEIVEKIQALKEGALRAGDDFSANCYGTVMNVLLGEFEANGGRL